MAWSNCQRLKIKKELVLVFFECLCSHKNMERDFVLPFRQVAVPTLCQGPISEGRPSPALPFSCDFCCYSEWQRKLHAHFLKSLVKILGIFMSHIVVQSGRQVPSASLCLLFHFIVCTVTHPEHLVAIHKLAVLHLWLTPQSLVQKWSCPRGCGKGRQLREDE